MYKYTFLFYHLYINIASLIKKIACLYNKNINYYYSSSVLCAVNISYIIKRNVMWTHEMITKGKMLDLITNCLNYMPLFLLEMYGDRPVWGIFLSLLGLKGRNVKCFYCDGAGKPKITFLSLAYETAFWKWTRYKRNWQVYSAEMFGILRGSYRSLGVLVCWYTHHIDSRTQII